MKRVYVLVASLLVGASIVSAQDQDLQKCSSSEVTQRLHELYPELVPAAEAYNLMLKQALEIASLENTNGKTTDGYLDTTTQYKIPVVYHILHTYNEYGNDWISDDQVKASLASVNHHFNGSYLDTADVVPYFKDKVGNARITFVLANKDPQGNCTNGIDRIYSYKAITGTSAAKLNQWQPDRYINIWVAQVAGLEGAAAFAIKPPDASNLPYFDGIMSSNSYVVGRPSSRESTIAHEIGHMLNLDHVWGGTNAPEVACGDDDVLDTPPTEGHYPRSNCNDPALRNEREENCWSDTATFPFYSLYLLDSNCVSNMQNIMDYTYCDRMFTKGQTRRMRAVLQNISGAANNANRENLITAATHAFTGIDGAPVACAPKSDFHTDQRFLLENALAVDLRSYSYNTNMNGASYSWSAPNSTVATSTNTNFSTQYPTGNGWNDVSLTTTAGGQSDTKTKANYIFVQHTTPSQKQDFEDAGKNYWWPTFNYFENRFKWEISTYGGNSGTNAMLYRGYNNAGGPSAFIGDAYADFDDFFTEPYDMTNLSTPKLNFYISGAANNADPSLIYDDELEISYSTNGGRTWRNSNATVLHGPQMYTKGVSLTEYAASGPWDYTPITIDLPSSAISSATIFRFRMKPGVYANNVYIDDINVTDVPTSIRNINDNSTFSISPNPLSEGTPLVINSSEDFNNTIINITDVTGRVIYSEEVNTNIKAHSVSRSVFPSAGFYIVNLTKEGKTISQKLNVL